MTTQTTNLLFQTTGANASAPRSASQDRLADSARNNGAFGATLSRQLAARQQAPQPQAPTPAAQQPKPAAQQQQSKPNAADKPANREPVREQAKAGVKPASHEGEAKTASAEGAEESGAAEGAAEAAAAATTPVTDMLAFMASLTRPASADAAAVPLDAAAAGDLQSKALESALEHMTGAAGSAAGDAAAGAAVTDELGKGVSLAAGVQRAPVDPNAPQVQTGALPEGQQDAAQFQTQLRESQQQLATAVEEAPAPLAQLQAQAAKMADAVGNPAAVPGDRIPARVGSQAWDNQVSQRIVYMVGKEQAATLTLNPPDLGPVQIVLNVSNDQASVAFSAEQLEVRQALENALPRLREMMSESGIALNNATVDAGARQQQQDDQRRASDGTGANGNLAGAGAGNEGEAAVNEVAPRTRTVGLGERGMVDLFA